MASYNMSSAHKERFYDEDEHVGSNPYQYGNGNAPRGSRFDPRTWGIKTKIAVAVGVVIVLVAIIVGADFGVQLSKYPAYSKLNYTISDTYSGTDFFEKFDYFTGDDPTSGFVHYLDAAGSEQLNLTYASSSQAVLKVDTTETKPSTGRKSARITSKTHYDNGLFVFDITNSPYGCGTWSSVWLADPSNWPTNGEIDVLESVNQGTSGNQMTLHTTDGCTMKNVQRRETGTVLKTNCFNSSNANAGCGVSGPTDTYGEAFNKKGGGVYALEIRDDGIRSWFFSRSSIPADITSGSAPDPSTWGTAFGDFPSTDCNIGSHFKNQSIIVNIDLCGSWAGAAKTYTTQDKCPGTCKDFVTNNAKAFDTAFWSFNSFKVYSAS